MSSRQTSHKKKIKRILIAGIVLSILLLLLPRVFGVTASLVMVPVVHFETMLANVGGYIPDFFRDRIALVHEVERLEERLANETTSEVTVSRLITENKTLRRLLGSEEEKRIVATIIGRPTVTPYDVIVIDKGTRNGIVKDAPVYVGFDQAIGYVAEVFPTSAVITLLSTPGFEASVYIYGPNIYTTARGIGGGVLEVSVPQGILLQRGDPVVVPALGAGVYGSIEVVNSIPTEPEQRGYVSVPVPLQSMRFVSVGAAAINPLSFEDAVKVVDQVKKDLAVVPVPSGVLVEVVEDIATSTATSTEQNLQAATSTTE